MKWVQGIWHEAGSGCVHDWRGWPVVHGPSGLMGWYEGRLCRLSLHFHSFLMCLHTHVCIGARGAKDLHQICSPVIFHWIFQDSLAISLELTSSALLAGWKASGSSCPLSHHRNCRCLQSLPAFYIGAGDLNSRPHAGIASTLPTEPSSWPLSFIYLFVCLLYFVGVILVYFAFCLFYFSLFWFLYFGDSVLKYGPDWPWTHYVAYTGPEFVRILLALSPRSWDESVQWRSAPCPCLGVAFGGREVLPTVRLCPTLRTKSGCASCLHGAVMEGYPPTLGTGWGLLLC